MSKNSAIDYWGYILVKFCGWFIRRLPLGLVVFLGRRVGDIMYCFDLKHRAIAYANIKCAFAKGMSLSQIRRTTREFYRNFGQNLIDIFLVPLVNEDYIKEHITIENNTFDYPSYSKRMLGSLDAIEVIGCHSKTNIIYVTHYPQEIPSCMTHLLQFEKAQTGKYRPRSRRL